MSSPTVAVIGASPDRQKFGNRCVRAYAAVGYTVFPVHPRATEIEGHKAYPTLAAVPVERLDRVSLYLPPDVALQVLPELTHKAIGELWLNPGADSPEVVARARELGLPVVVGCSIVDVGVDPHALD
jgi:predicted CoA-binding protein